MTASLSLDVTPDVQPEVTAEPRKTAPLHAMALKHAKHIAALQRAMQHTADAHEDEAAKLVYTQAIEGLAHMLGARLIDVRSWGLECKEGGFTDFLFRNLRNRSRAPLPSPDFAALRAVHKPIERITHRKELA